MIDCNIIIKNMEKRKKKIVNDFENIINNIEIKDINFVEKYLNENYLNINLQKFIKKEEEKYKNKFQIKCVADDLYINTFNNYYYNSTSNIYFYYDKYNYINIKDDDINYEILKSLQKYKSIETNNKLLIKNCIFKKIKSNNYEEIIPESNTIQKIMNYLNPNIFESKNYCKFFLIFLGDIILKKNKKEKLFILNCNNDFKLFLKKINRLISLLFYNLNIFNNIKTKFYGHDTKNTYILYLNNNINSEYLNIDVNYFINLLFISIYNSKRYENIHTYLEWNKSLNDINYVSQLNNLNIENIIENFWEENIIIKQGNNLKDDSVLFLWKNYLKKQKLPCYLLFQQELIKKFIIIYKNKTKVKDNIIDEKNIIFHNITSFNIPEIQKILDFWDEYIIYDESEYFLDIDEIEYYFSLYIKEKYNKNYYKTYININILDVIKHYFCNDKIIYQNNKYFNNLKIKSWNKKKEIEDFYKKYNKELENLTFEKIYNLYCKTKKINQQYHTIINKNYFKKFVKTI